jgi:2-oxoglutarate ferredoxin oxidoreductase subunit gamma
MVANIVMVGFLAAHTDLIAVEALRESVRNSVPAGTENLNLEAFQRGYDYGINPDSQAAEAAAESKT